MNPDLRKPKQLRTILGSITQIQPICKVHFSFSYYFPTYKFRVLIKKLENNLETEETES